MSLAAAWLASCALAVASDPSASVLVRSSAPPFSSEEAASTYALAAAPFDLADHPMLSGLSFATGSITEPREEKPAKPGKKPKKPHAAGNESDVGLGPERAQILLRSLTVPGWGQASLGLHTSAKVFALVEAGIWGSYIAFRIQEAQRTDTYLRTARLDAGIDLRDQDDEFRRIVGAYASSDEYNLLVVSRDAANLYLSDPNNEDIAAYRAYIDKHSLKGDQAWHWTDESSFLRYGGQRKNAQRAGLRSNTALGLAVANRIVSALHAVRAAGHKAQAGAGALQGWHLDLRPGLDQPDAFQAALTTRF